MVGRQIGFTLGAVEHQGVHLLASRNIELDSRGERGAAKTDDTLFPCQLRQLLNRHGFGIGNGLHLHPLILEVVVNDHTQLFHAIGQNAGRHIDHNAGDRSMNRSAHRAGRFANHLSDFHVVSLGNQRLAGSSNMLLQRDHNTRGLRSGRNRHTGRDGLATLSLMRMDAAGKTVYGTHAHSSFLNN